MAPSGFPGAVRFPGAAQIQFRRRSAGNHRLEVARLAGFSADELDLYDRVKIAEQDARGALSLAERVGVEKGLRKAICAICQAFEIELDADREATLAGMGADELDGLHARLLRERCWD